jgi:hypothetical protein
MVPFEIKEVEDHIEGTNRHLTGKLLGDGKMFKRRAIRWKSGDAEPVEWLVMEIDGVRTYIIGNDIIMTKDNLRP